MFAWFTDCAEKKARKIDLQDVQHVMASLRTLARNVAIKAGESSQRVLIEKSETDKQIAVIYADVIENLQGCHRALSRVEHQIELEIDALGHFSRWRQRPTEQRRIA
mgnify:CR=1 FL=1|tara:strand:+ start:75 stop:395 length:321 start_codon:yes stop_codon:yes gene_type:complete